MSVGSVNVTTTIKAPYSAIFIVEAWLPPKLTKPIKLTLG